MMQTAESDVRTLAENVQRVRHRIEAAAQLAGRSPDDISLLAVSKGQSAAKILHMHEASGLCDFGENYAQELLQKANELSAVTSLRWHYIGQLQSNKIPKLIPIVASIHSVSSEKQIRLIAQHALLNKKTPFPIYLSVNAGNEASKGGLSSEEALALAALTLRAYQGVIALEGIMSIPPASFNDTAYPSGLAPLYQDLYHCAKQVGRGRLSLGMSSDLALAIRSGSTCVRIGTALFGERS